MLLQLINYINNNLKELKKLETIYKLKNNKLFFSIYILEKNLNHTKYIDNLNINDFSILLYKYIDDTYKVFIKNKKFDIEIENEKMRITIFNLNNYINFSIWLKEHSIKNSVFNRNEITIFSELAYCLNDNQFELIFNHLLKNKKLI